MTRSQKTFVARGGMMRTPLLPTAAYFGLSANLKAAQIASDDDEALLAAVTADRHAGEASLRTLLEDEVVREAVRVASPGLDEAIERWMSDPRSLRSHDVPESVSRYLARMACRPTPFGLFAGCSAVATAPQTVLSIAQREHYRRHTRIAMAHLSDVVDAIARTPEAREHLTYRVNETLYIAGTEVRYAESRVQLDSGERTYHLVAAPLTSELSAAISAARRDATRADVVRGVCFACGRSNATSVGMYVDALIDNQLLQSTLRPALTGRDALEGMIAQLERDQVARESTVNLREIAVELAELDAGPLRDTRERESRVLDLIARLPASSTPTKPLHVDMYKPAPYATLGEDVLSEVIRAAKILQTISPTAPATELDIFRADFRKRYGERLHGPVSLRELVPLLEALDEEIGVGFGATDDPAPLLKGLPFTNAFASPAMPCDERAAYLLKGLLLGLASPARVWELTDSDVEALRVEGRSELPPLFGVMATLTFDDSKPTVFQPTLIGPSGAELLGRFCSVSTELTEIVRAQVRDEEARMPEVIFAELVHEGEGRAGNILGRPALREFEIPLIGGSSVPPERQLALSDLSVTLEGDRVVLWSRSHDKEVRPRLTSAHAFGRSSLRVYRFLAALQAQDHQRVSGWSWGVLGGAPRLPRVASGRAVLAAAEWNLEKTDLASLRAATPVERLRAIRAMRKRLEIPRVVSLVDGDNVLPVDLENTLQLDSFIQLVQSREAAKLQELLLTEGGGGTAASSVEGNFVTEIAIPFVTVESATSTSPVVRDERVNVTSITRARERAHSLTEVPARTFVPGSAWLYMKFYCGQSAVDRVLIDVVARSLEDARERRDATRWFFIRYADPDWHLRLRVKTSSNEARHALLDELSRRASDLLLNGVVQKLETSTYVREFERYGGGISIELFEELFEIDSDVALAICAGLGDDGGEELRWRLALVGCHVMLDALDLGLNQRVSLLKSARDAMAAEQRASKSLEIELGTKFRNERRHLEALVAQVLTAAPPDPAFAHLMRLSRRARPIVQKLRRLEREGLLLRPINEMAWDVLHMHVNRILPSSHRRQEFVIYDWLHRLYKGQAARAKMTAKELPGDDAFGE